MLRRIALATCAMAALGACRDRKTEAPPPAADTLTPAATTGRVELRLDATAELAWNQTDSVRLTVSNGTAQALTDAVLTLFVQSPVIVPPDPAAAASPDAPRVTATAEGTRVAFRIDSLPPGGAVDFQQAVRTPPAPPAPPAAGGRRAAARPDTAAKQYLLRAWLATRGGVLVDAPVQDTLRIRAGSEVTVGGCGNVNDLTVTRYGVGPVRLGMPVEALRTNCPEARDTAWRGAGGTRETGIVALPGGERVVALTDGQTVTRIIIDRPGLKTAAGLGVGATVGDLRTSYGRMCAGAAERQVAVWFPNAPGLGFGLDTVVTRRWDGLAVGADSIPDDAPVSALWVRQGTDDCPARPAQGGGR